MNGHPRAHLKDQAYENLKRLILEEVFTPGTRLSERQLAARLDMSKTPIRAAIEQVEAEGFVALSPQQGIVVRERSPREVVDLFDICIALEGFAVQSIAERLDLEQFGQLRANLKPQEQAAMAGDVAACTRLDAEFHTTLCELVDNREISQVMRGLRDKLYMVVLGLLRTDAQRLMISYFEHEGIVEAVANGQGAQAAERVKEHLEYEKRLLTAR